MNKNSSLQKGSAHVVIITILVIALLCALGFIFWQNFIQGGTVVEQAENQAASTQETKESNKKLTTDTTIHLVDIKMQTVADVDKLPDFTPVSFREYMTNLLSKNQVAGSGCEAAATQYQISKISQVNIQGGVVPVTQDVEACPGGAPVIWVLAPNGTWDEESLNGPLCTSKSGGLIYEEFVLECYLGPDASSFVDNPNGSITSLSD